MKQSMKWPLVWGLVVGLVGGCDTTSYEHHTAFRADGSVAPDGCTVLPEVCDGVDNDCDGLIDNDDPDYGPTTQVFFGGRGTVAVPGMPRGLWELHQRHGQLPMAQLAQPAVRAASEGVPVTRCFEDTGTLVGNILRLTPAVEALLRRPDGPMRAGDLFHHPLLGQTIARYATEGPQFLETGDGAQAMLRMLGAASAIGPLDLQQQRPMRREPLRLRYRDAQVWLPGAPSLGGLLVACAMAHLQAAGPMPPLPGAAFVRRVAEAMQAAETRAGPALLGQMSQPGFQASFLASCPLGSTTHISAMDRAGNAVGLTTSLGATSGHMVPETGILLNNFLGERDVNPPHPRRSPGQRLVTMTCPTLLHTGASSFIMGSGGSSRIRSAIMHGLMYLVDHRLPAAQAVGAPRSHMEGGSLRVELTGRPAGTWGALRREHPSAVPFSTPDFYFGGLHVAGLSSGVFVGAGDTRRSGEFGWT